MYNDAYIHHIRVIPFCKIGQRAYSVQPFSSVLKVLGWIPVLAYLGYEWRSLVYPTDMVNCWGANSWLIGAVFLMVSNQKRYEWFPDLTQNELLRCSADTDILPFFMICIPLKMVHEEALHFVNHMRIFLFVAIAHIFLLNSYNLEEWSGAQGSLCNVLFVATGVTRWEWAFAEIRFQTGAVEIWRARLG